MVIGQADPLPNQHIDIWNDQTHIVALGQRDGKRTTTQSYQPFYSILSYLLCAL